MNTVMLSGIIQGTPETKSVGSGGTLLTTATIRALAFTKRNEAQKYDDVRVEAFGDAGKALVRAGEGGRVLAIGRVRVNTWTAQDGSPRSAINIAVSSVEQLMDVPAAEPTSPAPASQPETYAPPATNDEVPF
jgi:single-stranded DNA-binding protein